MLIWMLDSLLLSRKENGGLVPPSPIEYQYDVKMSTPTQDQAKKKRK